MDNYNIKVDEGKYKYGYVRGSVGDFYWYALVHRSEIEHGINPMNLQTGSGRISRLCVYKEFSEEKQNPYLPPSSIKRYIYANYKREWDVLNSNYVGMVKQLVDYLERRYSLHLVRGGSKDE
jgi:hypothetical protein